MANPTFESIRLAIERRLAIWDGVPVEYDGAQQSPALKAAIEAKQPWVRCTILSGNSNTVGVSDKPCVRRSGLVSLQIFTPEHAGSAPALRIADSLGPYFEHYQSGHFETQAVSLQRIGPQNGWYQVNLTAPYRAG